MGIIIKTALQELPGVFIKKERDMRKKINFKKIK